MTPKQVVEHFGGVANTAKALKMSRQIIYQWTWDQRIPELRQLWIERKTNGKLRATSP